MANLRALDTIAKENGGNRAFGLPGYNASVQYILQETKKSKSWTVKTQDFPGLFNKVTSISLRVSNTSYYVYGLTYSPSTSAEGITAPLVLGASGDVGCTAAGYTSLDVKGKIVLVQRGSCPDGTTIAGRMKPAAAAGAVAVIVYSNTPLNVTAGTLSAPNPAYVPSGFINQVDGVALKAKLDAGESLSAYFQQTQTIETRITQNIFAESKGGDPNNVIMLGAHLDSVQAGAGINDDGSGTSLILEIFQALQKFKFKNKIRIAWWGAEENGLVGSRYYTSTIDKATIDSLLLYLNFDMVSRGYFGVFDGDGSSLNLTGPAGSDVIEKLFVDDLTSKGITVTPAAFTGGSDYASFMNVLRKPVGGLHTGTGIAQDDCYHQACDVYGNANSTVLTVNAKVSSTPFLFFGNEKRF